MFLSFQDFEKENDKAGFIKKLIDYHNCSQEVRVARDADQYDIQENITIKRFQKVYYTLLGQKRVDNISPNNKIASNFFHNLNTQRCNYLLGNGIKLKEEENKEKLGKRFDKVFKDGAYYALIHGQAFIYWNVDKIHCFRLTEFAPLWDEDTGALRAGVRFWQIDVEKPLIAVLYEEDGYTKYRAQTADSAFEMIQEKKGYRQTLKSKVLGAEPDVIGEENYGVLPIVPMYGNKNHRSTLPGMRAGIDAYDLVLSGFANDMVDVAEIYWLVQNADGMSDEDLRKFFDRMKLNHIVNASDGASIQPYVQEVPYQARNAFLTQIRNQIYEDFCALDVHTVSAGATNDHIDAAYQPMDDECDEYEYCIDECMTQILELAGLDEEAKYKRNRISNEKEKTDMINSAADHLDDETYLSKLPFIEPDEIQIIMDRLAEEDVDRFSSEPEFPEEDNSDQEEDKP